VLVAAAELVLPLLLEAALGADEELRLVLVEKLGRLDAPPIPLQELGRVHGRGLTFAPRAAQHSLRHAVSLCHEPWLVVAHVAEARSGFEPL
jgi:hypothetical protein